VTAITIFSAQLLSASDADRSKKPYQTTPPTFVVVNARSTRLRRRPPSRATVAPRGLLSDDARQHAQAGRARASRAAANKRKKPLGIGRAARCQELPGLTRFRSPLNNALLPVMFRAAHIFATSGRASVRAGLAPIRVSYFVQTEERDRLKVADAGRLPEPPSP
jgi:hypothetical protein